MSTLKDILVVADLPDTDPTAIRRGLELAVRTSKRLTVVGFSYHSAIEDPELASGQRQALRSALTSERKTNIAATIAEEQANTEAFAEVGVTIKVVWTRSIEGWLAKDKQRYDLILKTGDDRRDQPGALDWRLVRHISTPILLAHQREWPRRARVLAAVDPQQLSSGKNRVALNQLRAARTLADAYSADLHICCVVEVSEILIDLDLVNLTQHRRATKRRITKALEELGPQFDIKKSHMHFPVGRVDEAVDSIAGKIKAEAIVVGANNGSGVLRKLLGNSAERLLAHMHTDVLVVPS